MWECKRFPKYRACTTKQKPSLYKYRRKRCLENVYLCHFGSKLLNVNRFNGKKNTISFLSAKSAFKSLTQNSQPPPPKKLFTSFFQGFPPNSQGAFFTECLWKTCRCLFLKIFYTSKKTHCSPHSIYFWSWKREIFYSRNKKRFIQFQNYNWIWFTRKQHYSLSANNIIGMIWDSIILMYKNTMFCVFFNCWYNTTNNIMNIYPFMT